VWDRLPTTDYRLPVHRDRWSLRWDDGEGTPVQSRAFSGAGAVAIDAPCAHAVRNDGASELQLTVLGELQPATHRRSLVDPAPRIAGVDGCPNGWVAVVKDGAGIRARIVAAPAELHALFDERDAALAATHKRARLDDVLDAFAALWTAERIASNQHGTLRDGHADGTELAMRIVY
jgi:predicted RNase H-like nuclease